MSNGTMINSFELPLRGWDFMRKVYITLAIWIFMAGVGAHAHMRNHFRSGLLSCIIGIVAFMSVVLKFRRPGLNRDFDIYLVESENGEIEIHYIYNPHRRSQEIEPENEGFKFLRSCVTALFYGISLAGPVIEDALNFLPHNPNLRPMILMGVLLYNLNMFVCASLSAMFQPTETFKKVFEPAAIIILVVMVLGLWIEALVAPNNHLFGKIYLISSLFLIHGLCAPLMGEFIDDHLNGRLQDYIPTVLFLSTYLLPFSFMINLMVFTV